ncbi:MAG: hypothetical protein H0W13_04205 [Nitrospirales bacterium]|nr:hypothetical protein [Nitrospirales bacterium]
MPIAELVAFCKLVEPKLILLSLTTVPASDKAAGFVKELGMQLTNQAVVIVGGAAAQAEMPLFAQAHIAVLDNLLELDRRLAPLVTSSRSRR